MPDGSNIPREESKVMKVYVEPANAVVLTPTGDGSSAQALKEFEFYDPNSGATTKTGLIPVEITSATEKSKNGSRRTMIKVATTLPKTVVNQINTYPSSGPMLSAAKDLRVQTHLVCECDEDLVRRSSVVDAESEGIDNAGVGVILALQLRALAAIVEGGESVPSGRIVLPKTGVLVRGLLGLEPLDVVNGSYGKADEEE